MDFGRAGHRPVVRAVVPLGQACPVRGGRDDDFQAAAALEDVFREPGVGAVGDARDGDQLGRVVAADGLAEQRPDYTFPVPHHTLADLYAYHSVLAPDTETEAYLTQIDAWLGQGRRRKKGDATWSKGDLRVTVHHDDALPQDERADRDIPPGFRPVDAVILSDEIEVSRTVRQLPGSSTGLGAPWTGRRVLVSARWTCRAVGWLVPFAVTRRVRQSGGSIGGG